MTEETQNATEESPVKPWGFHLIIDASGADHESITNADNITAFAKKLVKDIDMVAYGEPQVVRFGSGDKQGYTLVQLIETSNICCHFVEENDTFYLDVFSCKPFDPAVVLQLTVDFFKIQSYKHAYFERRA